MAVRAGDCFAKSARNDAGGAVTSKQISLILAQDEGRSWCHLASSPPHEGDLLAAG